MQKSDIAMRIGDWSSDVRSSGLLASVRLRAPGVTERLARQVAAAVEGLRGLGLYKPPGVAETIDWALALSTLGLGALDEVTVKNTLGTVLKYREHPERALDAGLDRLGQPATERPGSRPPRVTRWRCGGSHCTARSGPAAGPHRPPQPR